MIAGKGSNKARFCGPACRDSLRCDREHGAFHPGAYGPDGYYSAERSSLVFLHCAYCGAPVAGRAFDLGPNVDFSQLSADIQRAIRKAYSMGAA